MPQAFLLEMKQIICSWSLVLAITTTASLPTLSDELSTFYLGASIGSVDLQDSVFRGSNTIPVIYAGWNIFRYFGVELSYADFKDFETGIIHQQSTKALSLYGKAILPIGDDFSLFGKFGQVNWDSEVARLQDGFSVSDTGNDPAFGVGIDYQITRRGTLRLAYDIVEVNLDYIPIGPFFADINGKAELWSLGFHFGF